jgi:hypothetical protein
MSKINEFNIAICGTGKKINIKNRWCWKKLYNIKISKWKI